MSAIVPPAMTPAVEYPDSDGKPMADNTLQFQWIVTVQGNLDLLFRDRPDVFVAGDNLIYPVRGQVEICMAPDVYVAFGRPKGHRGSYKVWEEGGVFPQVVVEVLSPDNTYAEMTAKRRFYEAHGAEEFILIDPELDRPAVEVWVRGGDRMRPVDPTGGWTSPRLGVRFVPTPTAVELYYPDGRRFLTFVELGSQAIQERQRAEKLAAELRELGVDPDTV